MRAHRNREHGVTLVELMIVVVIIGVLGAVALPSFNRTTRDAAVKKQARRVTEIFHQFRGDAAATGNAIFLYLEGTVNQGSYWQIAKPGASGSCNLATTALPGGGGWWDSGRVYEERRNGDRVAIVPLYDSDTMPAVDTLVRRCFCIRPNGMLYRVACTGGAASRMGEYAEVFIDDTTRGTPGAGLVVAVGINSLAKVYRP